MLRCDAALGWGEGWMDSRAAGAVTRGQPGGFGYLHALEEPTVGYSCRNTNTSKAVPVKCMVSQKRKGEVPQARVQVTPDLDRWACCGTSSARSRETQEVPAILSKLISKN